jgi:hypothetical protein
VQFLAGLLWFKLGTSKRTQATEVMRRWPRTCRRGHPKKPGHTGCGQCTANYWRSYRLAREMRAEL